MFRKLLLRSVLQSVLLGLFSPFVPIVASLIMLTVGHMVDHISIKKVSFLTIIGLALSSILLGFSYHIVFLFIALIGLRLSGQGFLSHISMTIISKYYDKNRGKALSISSLGYSMGEAFFSTHYCFYHRIVQLENSGN